jgi:hypothetical protein
MVKTKKKTTKKPKIPKEKIIENSKKIAQIVSDFKVKMQDLKKKQHQVIENYAKSVEKIAIEKIRKQLK